MHNCSKFCMRRVCAKLDVARETESRSVILQDFRYVLMTVLIEIHRGITKMFLTRGNARVNQTPGLPSKLAWQLDIQVTPYKSKPGGWT
jgi:hypothetical protein